MNITENYTGALLVRQMDSRTSFDFLVFENGYLDFHECIKAKTFEKALEEAKVILENEGYEDFKIFPDYECCFQISVGDMLDEGKIVLESLAESHDDNYDGSIASYFSDPNHCD